MLACICDERTNKQLAVYLNGVDNVYLHPDILIKE